MGAYDDIYAELRGLAPTLYDPAPHVWRMCSQAAHALADWDCAKLSDACHLADVELECNRNVGPNTIGLIRDFAPYLDGYRWRNDIFPSFRPCVDTLHPNRFRVELAVTCYPNGHGTGFDADAFPPTMRGLASVDGPNRFWFAATRDGNVLEDLPAIGAFHAADDCNAIWNGGIKRACETWDWSCTDYPFDPQLVIYSK